ncbi:PEP-CTERM sorting domain-containing protein [Luteolibacter marinus]|uniref:PEP-CTERM sorting domain-containing protein n=1 Tax=Luteolibacter marinus TaxID=2776705 RepID=UPI001867941C|nr:PEP-CTERM sorting domain-containing protein [Luteolibacter marinus]
MTRRSTSILLAATFFAMGSSGRAATLVTFDNLALAIYQDSFSDGGWTISATSGGSGSVNLGVESNVGLQSSNVSDHVVTFGFPFVAGNPLTEVRISQTSGQPFKLEGLSLGDGFGNSNLRIEAYLGGVSAGYAAVDVNIFNSVVPVTFTGWDNLDEIRITNSTGGADLNFDLDDMTVAEAVPEPASIGLLGLGAVAFLRRRRK